MKTRKHIIAVCLDHSIGQLRTDKNRVSGIDLWPSVHDKFQYLSKKGNALMLLILRKVGAKDLADLQVQFPSTEIVAGASIGAILKKKALQQKEKPLVFVSLDRKNRQLAANKLKVDVVPHIAAVPWILNEERIAFAELITRRRPDIKTTGVLPYYLERRGKRWHIFGLTTTNNLPGFVQKGIEVNLLSFDFRTRDCALLRIDKPMAVSESAWPGAKVICLQKNRLLLDLGEQKQGQEITLENAHGALELLQPSPELLEPAEDPHSFAEKSVSIGAAFMKAQPEMIESVAAAAPEQLLLALPDAASFQNDARRYSGMEDLDTSGPVESRHIYHPDNTRVVNALVDELSSLGLCTYTHSFTYNGRTLKNVIADLPGVGRWRINPEILKKLIKKLKRYPRPWPKIDKEIKRQIGPKLYKELTRMAGGPLRLKLGEIMGIYRWYPWWKLRHCRPGCGAQIVLLGCHLDSSGNMTAGGYNPATDPAPGMDDNASGMAAVLAAARYLVAFRGRLRNTVRFCFFNGEEAGLLGSKAYATSLKMMKAPVKAAICADMIGYNSDLNHIFEIHAGYTDPLIRDKNIPIASTVASWASCVGGLQPAQIYKGTSVYGGAPDRNLFDPAINRSDHAAFHQQGFPAVAVTEDYFANLVTEPAKDPNPHYHTASDTFVDADYGASIAAAVSCAVKALAN